jgi:hypothetical protein
LCDERLFVRAKPTKKYACDKALEVVTVFHQAFMSSEAILNTTGRQFIEAHREEVR